MKAIINVKKEVDITTLLISAGVRYWEGGTVNGVEDVNGDLIPCRIGDRWLPVIDIDSGIITNWTMGVSANVHYKVCDDGIYSLHDKDGNVIFSIDGYVPSILDIERDSYGDYLIMTIDANGKIKHWNNTPDISDFWGYEE